VSVIPATYDNDLDDLPDLIPLDLDSGDEVQYEDEDEDTEEEEGVVESYIFSISTSAS